MLDVLGVLLGPVLPAAEAERSQSGAYEGEDAGDQDSGVDAVHGRGVAALHHGRPELGGHRVGDRGDTHRD
ncbi:hypothetical protein [Streptomyces canus]|uniref:hypothetical protein n=1 Tax=Streptomyces canus TaxID=58343 RepID=UPI003F4D2AF0